MAKLSNLQKWLLAWLLLVIAALQAGSSGIVRFGAGEEQGSGFGGTGMRPLFGHFEGADGDAGIEEVRISPEPNAVPVLGKLAEDAIRRLPEPLVVQPPVAIVTAPRLKSDDRAQLSITDFIEEQLQRDTVIYQRILESATASHLAGTELARSPALAIEPIAAADRKPAVVIAESSASGEPVAAGAAREQAPLALAFQDVAHDIAQATSIEPAATAKAQQEVQQQQEARQQEVEQQAQQAARLLAATQALPTSLMPSGEIDGDASFPAALIAARIDEELSGSTEIDEDFAETAPAEAQITLAELASYLVSNSGNSIAGENPSNAIGETALAPTTMQRPQQLRRPALPRCKEAE